MRKDTADPRALTLTSQGGGLARGVLGTPHLATFASPCLT